MRRLLAGTSLFPAALFDALPPGERPDAAGLADGPLIFLAIIAVQVMPRISWNRLRPPPGRA